MIARASFLTTLLFALLLSAVAPVASAAPSRLIDVRVGPHKRFDRVVFEFAAAAEGRITLKSGQKVEVRFANVEIPEDFTLPPLPSGLSLVKGLEAFREGDGSVLFEITLARDATPSEMSLPGASFRLAVDLAPRVTDSDKPDPKPVYIPGDLPIPTKFAEREPLLPDSMDPARVHAVLAYYYLSRGDTQGALSEAGIYQQLTGQILDQIPQPPSVTPPAVSPVTKAPRWHLPQWKLPAFPLRNFGLLGVLAAVFVAGLLGGALLRHLPKLKLRGFRLPTLKLPSVKLPERKPSVKAKERAAKKLHTELATDLETLDKAVSAEPPRAAKPVAPVAPPEPDPVPEPVLDGEQEMKESLMDRRVRRVLELNREGRSISAIAEELQMGQDEVKLILDLNQ